MSVGRIIGVTILLAALGGLAGALGGALIALGLLAAAGESPNFFVLKESRRRSRTPIALAGLADKIAFGENAE